MLIPFIELKDFALLLSNILRSFDPETMFWRKDSPVLFPNYDKDGFTPYKPIRKPFSVQILLEAFSRSCGYKSYNALLADQNRPSLLDVDLSDLNPAPRNAYFTLYWHTFIHRICDSAYEGFVNKAIPSYLTYRNFKNHDKEISALPFIQFGLDTFCAPGEMYFDKAEYLECYYPIALSIMLTAAKIGFDKDLISGWTLRNIELRRFLVHEQWQDERFEQFKAQIEKAMNHLFSASIVFVDQGDTPLDSLVSIIASTNISDDLEYAVKLAHFDKKLKEWVLKKCNAVTNDTSYYTDLNYKAISAIREDFKPKELAWHIKNRLKISNNINDHQIYGTKAFWLNQCYHLYTTRPEQLLHWSTENLLEHLDSQLTGMALYNEPDSTLRNFSYDFRITGITKFIENTNGLVGPKDIPKTITVYSDKAYPVHFIKMAIHSQIIALLPRESVDFEIHSKSFGNVNEIEFEAIAPHLSNPTLKITEIKPEKWSPKKAALSFDFNITQLIHSINIERIQPEKASQLGLKPYIHELSEYEHFDFQNNNGSYDSFMFTTGVNAPIFHCLLKIGLFETPYQANNSSTPYSGWNNCTLLCQLLDLDTMNDDEIELDLLLSNTDMDEKNRFEGLTNLCQQLENCSDFKKLLKNCLKEARHQWETHKWFIRGQGPENSNLNTLYQYTAHYPNGPELI